MQKYVYWTSTTRSHQTQCQEGLSNTQHLFKSWKYLKYYWLGVFHLSYELGESWERPLYLQFVQWKLGKFKENNMTDDKQILQTTIRFIHVQNTYIELQQQPH